MSLPSAETWLNAPLPDQQHIEAHVPGLLRLRQALRANRLDGSTAQRRLAEIIQAGRYLSILLVYQHVDLLDVILDERVPAS